MAVQMTRAEYQAKYGQPPATSAPVRMTREQYGAKYNAPTVNAPTKSLGQRILDVGTKVADFVGAKGISEQFGADIARMRAPADQKNLVQYPSMKSVVGSGMQFGANFIPGAGLGAGLTRKVATGAATGYAIDVGSKLQKERSLPEAAKPGLATALGAALPIAGKLTGLSNVASRTKKAAMKLEESSLKMTPVDKQNLSKQGKDIANFLSAKKLVGTPEQRYNKVATMYDDMERKITRVVDGSKTTFSKDAILRELERVPAKYVDNLSEYDGVVAKVQRIIETIKKTKGDSITASSLNRMKRAEWESAFAKNNTDVINDVSFETASVFKKMLDRTIHGLEPLNKEYGMIIASKRQLFKALSRPQAGLLGKAIGMAAGTALGGAAGAATGIGAPLGVAAGAYAGPNIANAIATPTRSTVGAGMQIASEAIKKARFGGGGVAQPIRKALLQSTAALKPEPTPESPQPPTQQSNQVTPSPHLNFDPGRVNEDGSMTFPGIFSEKEITLDPMMVGGFAAPLKAVVPKQLATSFVKNSVAQLQHDKAPKAVIDALNKIDTSKIASYKSLEEAVRSAVGQQSMSIPGVGNWLKTVQMMFKEYGLPSGLAAGAMTKRIAQKATGESAITAPDMLKDFLITNLQKMPRKIGPALDSKLVDEADEFLKFLQEVRNPTLAQMNKGLEILRLQGKETKSITDAIMSTSPNALKQLRDAIGRYAGSVRQ